MFIFADITTGTHMKSTTEYLRLLKEYKATRAALYGIVRIGLFGSVARSEHHNGSDVDVCVELSSPSLFTLVHIKNELQKLFGTAVDVVRIRKEMDTHLSAAIRHDGIYV